MTILLEVADLGCVRGGKPVFGGVSFRLESGAALVVRGPNGSGKSSLLRLLGGLARPDQGAISLDIGEGRVLVEELGRHSHLIGHKGGITDAMSVQANLRFQTELLGGSPLLIDAALTRLGLIPIAHQRAQTLSAGQRKRLALARLITVPRQLWLLDEPLESLDAEGEALVQTLLGEHCASGGIALVATHGSAPRAARLELALIPEERIAA
ncbi:MAG: heme ABC exporter ATP-binding protein CcmA [Alphaproteobacteria bacterium]